MPAVTSVVIEVDEKGAVSAIQHFEGEMRKVEGGFRKMGSTGNVVMTEMVKQQRQANDAAQLLGRTLGVQLPRQLNTFLATSKTIGPILAGAFNLSIIVGFAFALTRLPGLIDDIVEGMTGWRAETERQTKLQGELNKTLLESRDRVRDFREQLSLIGLSGSAAMSQEMRNLMERIAPEQENLSKMLANEERLRGIAADTATTFTQRRGRTSSAAEQAKKDLDDLQPKIEAQRGVVDGLTKDYAILDAKIRHAFGEENKTRIAGTSDVLNDLLVDFHHTRAEQERNLGATVGAMVEEQQRAMDEWNVAMEASLAFGAEKSRERLEIERRDAEKRMDAQERANRETFRFQEGAMRDFAHARADMTANIIGLFDDISTGSVAQRFRSMFKRLIAGMVADWMLGVKTMGAVSAGGGVASGGASGVLGTIFGGGFGGFGSGPGATPPFIPENFTNTFTGAERSMLGLPLSAGQGAGLTTAMPAGGEVMTRGQGHGLGGAGSVGSFLGRMPGGAVLQQLMTTVGAASVLGFGSPVRGAISGAAAGILGSSAIAAAFPSTIPFLLGLGVPVIGAIGAGIGLLIGSFGNSKRARQRHELHEDLWRQIAQIEDQYKFFGIDYGSARGTLEQMRQEYIEQFAKLKGKRDFVDPFIDRAVERMNIIEAERQRRAAMVFGPAQFERGGLVGPLWLPLHFAGGGEVPAILHRGEFVMRESAVQRHGRAKLEAMNQGGAGGGPTIIVNNNVSAWDGRSVSQYYNNGGLRTLQRAILLAIQEGRWN